MKGFGHLFHYPQVRQLMTQAIDIVHAGYAFV